MQNSCVFANFFLKQRPSALLSTLRLPVKTAVPVLINEPPCARLTTGRSFALNNTAVLCRWPCNTQSLCVAKSAGNWNKGIKEEGGRLKHASHDLGRQTDKKHPKKGKNTKGGGKTDQKNHPVFTSSKSQKWIFVLESKRDCVTYD